MEPTELPFSSRLARLISELKSGGVSPGQSRYPALKLLALARTESELDLIQEYFKFSSLGQEATSAQSRQSSPLRTVAGKLLEDKPLHVLFVNDNGYYAGAGIATSRQVQSFLLAGHRVSVLALNPAPAIKQASGRISDWLMRKDFALAYSDDVTEKRQTDRAGFYCYEKMFTEINASQEIDLVVIGNLHSDKISPVFFIDLLARGIPVVHYSHDCDIITGGCAYPQYYDCNNYTVACKDSNCPKTPADYPHCSYGQISKNFIIRSLLAGLDSYHLCVNSSWVRDLVARRFPGSNPEIIHLGVDTEIFRPPESRDDAKIAFGLSREVFVIAIGSDSMNRKGKGGSIVAEIVKRFGSRESVRFLCFGHSDLNHGNVVRLGYVGTDEEVARVFQAADVFLNPVDIEAFGQTFLEASACGAVPIGLRKGGVQDVVVHNITGFLVDTVEQILVRIERLRKDQKLLGAMSRNCSEHAAVSFSLHRQYVNWVQGLAVASMSPVSPIRHGPMESDEPAGSAGPASPIAATPISRTPVQGPGMRPPTLKRMRNSPEQPLVSIITTTRNCEVALRITRASIQMQGYPNIEWVVQDCQSVDSTEMLVRESGLDIRWHSTQDAGIYDAMNKGVSRASGEWVLFVQAGDWLAGPDAIQSIIDSCALRGDIVCAPVYEVSIHGKHQLNVPDDPTDKFLQLKDGSFASGDRHWLSGMPCHQGILMRRAVLRDIPFDTSYRVSADWHQLFSALSRGCSVETSRIPLAWYPHGGFSYENSDLWIEDVIRIAREFCPDRDLVDSYFGPVLAHHRQTTEERRRTRADLEASLKRLGKITSRRKGESTEMMPT